MINRKMESSDILVVWTVFSFCPLYSITLSVYKRYIVNKYGQKYK